MQKRAARITLAAKRTSRTVTLFKRKLEARGGGGVDSRLTVGCHK